VEAGLRTFDMHSPFPEELNRKTLALITSLHFTSTEGTRRNLVQEGIDPSKIFVTGNTVIDAVRRVSESLHQFDLEAIKGFVHLDSAMLILVTMHRRENQEIMSEILSSIAALKCTNCVFVLPVHPNPAAACAATKICAEDTRFHCVPPLDYPSTQWMLNQSRLVLTDSGGLQEESTWYGTPTIVLRDTTERPEAVHAGVSKLMGRNLTHLEATVQELIQQPDSPLFTEMSRRLLPFGDGYACELIEKIMLNHSQTLNAYAPIKFREVQPKHEASMMMTPCRNEQEAEWSACSINDTVTIALTVWKRNSLARQLDEAAQQSIKPSQILVIQNENHVDARSIILEWERKNPDSKVHLVHFSKNSGYHGRFHVVYLLSNTEYVSVWDDDVIVGPDWVMANIRQSKMHSNALMGGNGRCILSLPSQAEGTNIVRQEDRDGQNDFVGHSWTLKRDYLRYYFAVQPLTYVTGEDAQLSFALQLNGIMSFKTQQYGNATLKDDEELFYDQHASSRRMDKNLIRNLLFCQII
jgi:hypothetical protein